MTDNATGSAQAGNPGTGAAATAPVTTATAVAPTTSTGAVATSTPPAAPAPGAYPEWLKGADDTTIGYVQNKGWTEPTQVLEGYRNLEKLLGADKAGRTVVLPGEKAEQAEVDAFYAKLGRPVEAKDYKIPVPEGHDPAFAEAAKGKFHELGLTSKQAEALAAWNNEYIAGLTAAQNNQKAEAFNKDVTQLKTDWGAAHDQNVVIARNAAAALGLDAKLIDGISAGIGHKATMELLHKIGSKTGEDGFVGGTSTNYSGALTPGQAKARIGELRTDKAWTARYLSGDAEAKAEMSRLQQYANPETKP